MNGLPPTVCQEEVATRSAVDSTAADLVDRARTRLRLMARKLFGYYPQLDAGRPDGLLDDLDARFRCALERVAPASPADLAALAAGQLRKTLIDAVRRAQEGGRSDAATKEHDPHETRVDPGRKGEFDPRPDPERWGAWAAFHAAVDALPADERAAMDLLWYLGLPPAASAALLGHDTATLTRHWQTARLRLYEQLDGQLPPED